MSKLSLIIKREFIAKVRNKSFIIMTFLSPLIFVGISFLIAYLSNLKTEISQIGIHDESGFFKNDFKSDEEYHFTDVSNIDRKILLDSVHSKYYEGIIFIPKLNNIESDFNKIEYISDESPSIDFITDIEDKISTKLTDINLTQKGIDTLQINKAKIDVNLNMHKASGEETVRGLNEIKVMLGSIFGYLIMMFIIIYGNMVMRSVIEEKTNRIIEVIVSSVKPKTLMMGKIVGTTFAGILQFLIWVIVGGILMFGLSAIFGINTMDTQTEMATQAAELSSKAEITKYIKEILELPILSLLFYFLLYFIGGYFLYSSIYAAIGAAVDNETDTQQFMFPVIMPLMLGVYIGFFTVINEPHGTVATIFSMIPFTSPIVMLMRIPFGVPFYQILISLVLLFATFVGMVWMASKIYRVGILMYGKKPSWKELWKWLKY